VAGRVADEVLIVTSLERVPMRTSLECSTLTKGGLNVSKFTKLVFVLALAVTSAALLTWQITGGDYYTKYEVVEQIEKTLDPDDPLVAAGFYDGSTQTETVTRKDFRFGLLPTPSGLFDKHAASVVSVASPLWLVGFGLALWTRRRRVAH
jgi:hypothetical protein